MPIASCPPAIGSGLDCGPRQQKPDAKSQPAPSEDPLSYVTKAFPESIEVKHGGHSLEFCPDNTCDGFASANGVPVPTLKDFAYLYIYFFSDFTYLPGWRKHTDARDAALQLLSKPEYRTCQNANAREAARCVLLQLSRGGKIKLIFVRYDEHQRSVMPRDIRKVLSEAPPQ
jgi:hypothetical protein